MSLTKLETVSLLTNPVTTNPHYRDYIAYKQVLLLNSDGLVLVIDGFLFRFPKLRLLDFRKIRQKDRKAAIELFKSKKGKDILKEIAKKAKAAASNPMAADSNYSKGNCISISNLYAQ